MVVVRASHQSHVISKVPCFPFHTCISFTVVFGTSVRPPASFDTICTCLSAPTRIPDMGEERMGHAAMVGVPVSTDVLPV